ncbi:pro-resilin-like [Penaeus vannamei]|uniref:pro-resilin-like n=1 Tax=Penaeus vannamei TaxID=6689 RepID=UPI00387F7DB7
MTKRVSVLVVPATARYLTQFIEDGFENQLKTGVVLVDLTAAYDIVSHKGLLRKVTIALLSLAAAAAWAVPQEGYKYPAPGDQGLGTGSGQVGSGFGQAQYPSVPAQYNFQWDVSDQFSGNFYGHQEQREDENTQGKYYVLLPDGRRLVVEYYVDNAGYHPSIAFEGEAQFPSGPSRGSGQGYGQGGSGGNQGFGQGGPGQGQGFGQGSGSGQGQSPSQSYLPPSK